MTFHKAPAIGELLEQARLKFHKAQKDRDKLFPMEKVMI